MRTTLICESLRAPRLPEAACVSRAELFIEGPPDEPVENYRFRNEAAIQVCSGCPEIVPCQAWVDGLPEAHRPVGVVVAGNVVRKRRAPNPPRKGTHDDRAPT